MSNVVKQNIKLYCKIAIQCNAKHLNKLPKYSHTKCKIKQRIKYALG